MYYSVIWRKLYSMKRERKLGFNTFLFALSNFGSKAISFFLVPLYTALLTTSQYGEIDLIITSNSLLTPLVTLSMGDAVLRFSVDKEKPDNDIFTTGLFAILGGNLIGIVVLPILNSYFELNEYLVYSVLILFFNSIYTISSQFCRGISKNVQFAIGGIVQTLVLVISNLVLLITLSLGIKGYLISLILSYAISVIFLFISAKLYLYLNGCFYKKLFLEMFKYALPLIPNTILWWVMNASDKFFIANILGKNENGIYAVAYKFPSIINILSTIFFQAWQLSAIEEVNSQDKNEYYSKVFNNLFIVISLGMSLIIFLLKPVFKIWTAATYYEAWKCSWILLFAVMFTCFSSFWGSNLMAVKKTGSILKSAIIGGCTNILLNTILIPLYGLYGASIATLIGFLLMWIKRVYDGRNLFQIKINYPRFLISLSILLIQSLVLYCKQYYVLEAFLFGVMIVVNHKFIFGFLKNIFIHIKHIAMKGCKAK